MKFESKFVLGTLVEYFSEDHDENRIGQIIEVAFCINHDSMSDTNGQTRCIYTLEYNNEGNSEIALETEILAILERKVV